jgi:hypothetical protein
MSNLPATFEQRVKERISETIADLIPAEELDQLVKAQVAHFQRTELPEMIKTLIRAQFQAAINAEFEKGEYKGIWQSNGHLGASEAVSKIIQENAGAVLQSLIGGMVQMTIQQMQNNVPRMY